METRAVVAWGFIEPVARGTEFWFIPYLMNPSTTQGPVWDRVSLAVPSAYAAYRILRATANRRGASLILVEESVRPGGGSVLFHLSVDRR